MKILLLLIFLTSNWLSPYNDVYDLQEAIDKKLVKLTELTSVKGTHLRIKVENLQKRKDIKLLLPKGLEFVSVDTSEQDVILMEDRTLFVKAAASSGFNIEGYCTQANNRTPSNGSAFLLKGKNSKESLQKLANYLSNKKKLDNYLVQHAIWVLTNDHDLRGLHADDPLASLEMQKFIAELSGKEMPKYTIRYEDGTEGQFAFSGIVAIIYGNFEYDLDKDCSMTLEVYNEKGEMVQTVFKDMLQKKGHSKFQFKLKARDLPKGNYYSKLYKDGEFFQEMQVEV